ncbi:TIR-like protein FxsC [Streptomyces sp. NPDC001858]
MIATLRSALVAAGYDPTPEELADILWLGALPHIATSQPVAGGGSHARGRPVEAGGTSAVDPDAAPDQQMAAREQSGSRVLYASADWSGTGGATVSPTRLPTPGALPHARSILKALRPLRSTVRSHTRLRLDVGATVTALADGLRNIVLTPEHELLLDLTFVVDDGISMAVWHDAAKELHQELHRLRAFRRIRLLGMNTDDPEQVRFTAEPFRQNAPIASPPVGGRTLLLVLSDGVGHAWQAGKAQERLMKWATKGPTAVFHVLPEDRWPDTTLPTVRLMASATRPAVANHHIRLRHPRLPRDILSVPSPPVPVIDIVHGRSVRAWAQLIGAPSGESALHFYDPKQVRAYQPSLSGGVEIAPEAALEEFLAYGSDSARRVAAHLACAGSALTVPLMRLVQRSAAPSSGPEHLAEVFLAGLLTPCKAGAVEGAEPLPHLALPWDQRSFAFPPAVADSLRELVRRSDERATHDYVTGYLAQQHKAVKAGTALISDPRGALRAQTDLPLGSVTGGPGTRRVLLTGAQASLQSLTVRLNGLMDRMQAPRLEWVHEALAAQPAVTSMQRVADLLNQAAAQERAADNAGEYDELQRVLDSLARELGRADMAAEYAAAIAALRRGGTGPYFHLSYAHTPTSDFDDADPNRWVHQLFRDLCGHIRNLTSLPEPIGFMHRSLGAAHRWNHDLADSLAGCRVFVPLYSPRYFNSVWCSKEWSAFAQRTAGFRAEDRRGAPGAIVPALWTPVEARRIPEPARYIQYLPPELDDRYRAYGLYGLMKLSAYRNHYQRAVFELARRIVDAGENVTVEPVRRVDFTTLPDAFAPATRPAHSDSLYGDYD